MKIAIGSDHAGYELKNRVIAHLNDKGFDIIDKGTDSTNSTDYPDYAHAVANAVEMGAVKTGIVICGSGNGVAITANKHRGVRCALCWNAEISELARAHNDANVLSLPSRYISDEEALKIVDAFFNTEFEGGRHQRRVEKIGLV